MKIMVTGAAGQLGSEIVELLSKKKNCICFALDKNELDITDLQHVKDAMGRIHPDVVVNAAAYTQVDKAESEMQAAFCLNARGAANLAAAANAAGAKMCQISTDYVFDGTKREQYFEYDNTNPLGVYGRSKLAGEQLVRQVCPHSFIVRTAWLYGHKGSNFVKTMLRLGQERQTINVVDDQIGSPTFANDLAAFVCRLIESEAYGIYHGTNSGQCSWYEFACAIFAEARLDVKVKPITTAEYPTPAKRPAYSVLGHEMLLANGFDELRDWREALKDYFAVK